MKPITKILALVLFAGTVLFAYQSSCSVNVGMSKDDIYGILKPETVSREAFRHGSDTLVTVLPSTWNGNQSDAKFVLVFKTDTLQSVSRLSAM